MIVWLKRFLGYGVIGISIMIVVFFIVEMKSFIPYLKKNTFPMIYQDKRNHDKEEKLYLVKTDSLKYKVDMSYCGMVYSNKKKEFKVKIFPEHLSVFDKTNRLYYFDNKMINFVRLLPLEMFVPYLQEMLGIVFDDAGKFFESSRFQEYYKVKFSAVFNHNLKNAFENKKVKNKYQDYVKIVNREIEETFRSKRMISAIQRIITDNANRHLAKFSCITFKKPFIKQKCLKKFLNHFTEDFFEDPAVKKNLNDLGEKLVQNERLKEFLIGFFSQLMINLSTDRELIKLIKEMLKDRVLHQSFLETKSFISEKIFAKVREMVYNEQGIDPVVSLIIKEKFLHHREGFWIYYKQGDIPVFLRDEYGVFEIEEKE